MAKLERAKGFVKKRLSLNLGGSIALAPQDVQLARDYVAAYWSEVRRFHPKDDESMLGLPHPYLVPSYRAETGFDYNELYYWDSYFMVQGMLDSDHKELVKGILENLVYLFKRFKVIPNASRTYLTGRSQPPLLTSFIFDVYEHYDPGEKWLKKIMAVAEQEYKTVWMGVKKPNERQVHRGLSRYYDINYLHALAEAESGWDMTPRFDRRALNFLPVDLNAMLYKYETDFARAARILGDDKSAAHWDEVASQRKAIMDELMWSRLKGMYYEYNYVKEKPGTVSSLATYFPMWAGIIVVQGLERYGYHDDAKRIAHKWIKTNLDWFNQEHLFLEKYNVVTPDKPPVKGLYPSQTGFGWTNAVFERLCQDYLDRTD